MFCRINDGIVKEWSDFIGFPLFLGIRVLIIVNNIGVSSFQGGRKREDIAFEGIGVFKGRAWILPDDSIDIILCLILGVVKNEGVVCLRGDIGCLMLDLFRKEQCFTERFMEDGGDVLFAIGKGISQREGNKRAKIIKGDKRRKSILNRLFILKTGKDVKDSLCAKKNQKRPDDIDPVDVVT